MPATTNKLHDKVENEPQESQSEKETLTKSMEKTVQCCDWQQKYIALEKRMADMQQEMNSLRDRL